jgi:hypothetical protein
MARGGPTGDPEATEQASRLKNDPDRHVAAARGGPPQLARTYSRFRRPSYLGPQAARAF